MCFYPKHVGDVPLNFSRKEWLLEKKDQMDLGNIRRNIRRNITHMFGRKEHLDFSQTFQKLFSGKKKIKTKK